MGLLAYGVTTIAAVALTVTAFTLNEERHGLPTCDSALVKKIINENVNQETQNLVVSGLIDVTSDQRGGALDCSAALDTDRGPIPIKYSLKLVGPGNLQVSMATSLPK
ncbi:MULTISPECIES: hypothetical protein [Bradyrhizobium]|uniref:hypothetical protein n=1 Tax=Bradyrhizobium TaxID=374 RepID=UPI00057611F2|nr:MULTISPECIES: hypothetical protein [Bradyrhizobium]BBO04210.1 hypothetical protein SG09_35600 [Bradyrhizobium ottawaense]GMO46219.1 hypothetical protein BwSF21_62480 [Bradyrhizobium ottawaense]